MKLLNREPTEEMLIAGNDAISSPESRRRTVGGVFRAMYDAAPELKIDMEPVMSIVRNMSSQVIEKWKEGDVYDHLGMSFYSSEQLAAAVYTERKKWLKVVDQDAAIIAEGVKRMEAMQAKIDRLMFEHCPDDMTEEQLRVWGEHQVSIKNGG